MTFPGDIFRPPKQDSTAPGPLPKNTISFTQHEPPLIVAGELDRALEECKARVEKLARECRAKNRKFRDIEFDLERDSERCLHGLKADGPRYGPSDVRRVTQVFNNPQFFIDGPNSNDMIQGAIGDCWFVAALSTMSSAPGLVEKFCVARDEEIGIYGFIFFRNKQWVNVIIDDLLFISIPKYEELSQVEKELYHENKELYNKSARRGNKTLYFARTGTPGETWVPLIEKAYAKLHGDYRSLHGGRAAEAVEDLTGGVSSFISTKDILNPDQFWKDELLKVNEDRLFSCSFRSLDTTRSGLRVSPDVNGLIGSHAYSILRAVETRGKRFLVIRNPWGKSEWTGRWSDGAKEWTKEWISILDDLGHQFGDDGQFVMEYSDFLNTWEEIDRTILFNYNWVMSSQWLHVPVRPMPSAWGYGDVCFTINLSNPSFTVIVLSQLDDRYYTDLVGKVYWTMDFALFKKGEKDAITESSHTTYWTRSVNAETYLEAGEYVLHVRIDRYVIPPQPPPLPVDPTLPAPPAPLPIVDDPKLWDKRKHARVLTERALSQSIASNFNKKEQADHLPIPLSSLAGKDLAEFDRELDKEEKEKHKKEDRKRKELQKKRRRIERERAKKSREKMKERQKGKEKERLKISQKDGKAEADESVEAVPEAERKAATTNALLTPPADEIPKPSDLIDMLLAEDEDETQPDPPPEPPTSQQNVNRDGIEKAQKDHIDLGSTSPYSEFESSSDSASDSDSDDDDDDDDKEGPVPSNLIVDDNSIFLGLRVYTDKSAPATLGGQLRKPRVTPPFRPLQPIQFSPARSIPSPPVPRPLPLPLPLRPLLRPYLYD